MTKRDGKSAEVSDDALDDVSGGPHFNIMASDTSTKQFNYQGLGHFYYMTPADGSILPPDLTPDEPRSPHVEAPKDKSETKR